MEMKRRPLFWLLALLLSIIFSLTEAQSGESTPCIEGTVFTAFPGSRVTFDEAAANCSQLDPENESVLAAMRNLTDLAFVAFLLRDFQKPRYWIGIKDFSGNAGEGNRSTDRFQYLSDDQTGLSEFIEPGIANFPWSAGEPNNVGNIQDCVSLSQFGNFYYLSDDRCDSLASYICTSNCIVTSSPTFNPTQPPSYETTESPRFGTEFSVTTISALVGAVIALLVMLTLGFILHRRRGTAQILEVEAELEVKLREHIDFIPAAEEFKA